MRAHRERRCRAMNPWALTALLTGRSMDRRGKTQDTTPRSTPPPFERNQEGSRKCPFAVKRSLLAAVPPDGPLGSGEDGPRNWSYDRLGWSEERSRWQFFCCCGLGDWQLSGRGDPHEETLDSGMGAWVEGSARLWGRDVSFASSYPGAIGDRCVCRRGPLLGLQSGNAITGQGLGGPCVWRPGGEAFFPGFAGGGGGGGGDLSPESSRQCLAAGTAPTRWRYGPLPRVYEDFFVTVPTPSVELDGHSRPFIVAGRKGTGLAGLMLERWAKAAKERLACSA